jgi:hypothetical protein
MTRRKLPRKLKKRWRSTLRRLRGIELRDERNISNGLYRPIGGFLLAMADAIQRMRDTLTRNLAVSLYGGPQPSRLNRHRRRKARMSWREAKERIDAAEPAMQA